MTYEYNGTDILLSHLDMAQEHLTYLTDIQVSDKQEYDYFCQEYKSDAVLVQQKRVDDLKHRIETARKLGEYDDSN